MKKSIFKRFISAIAMAFTLCIMSISLIPASASASNSVSNVSSNNIGIQFIDNMKRDNNAGNAGGASGDVISAGSQQNGDKSGSKSADSAYFKVVNFILVWLRRAGFFVALIGAVMLGFAIKGNDADGKERGVLTMIAGFLVAAICIGANMFDLFT